MIRKFKITYLQYGIVKAKIIESSWYNLHNNCSSYGISESEIIKVELYLEASEEDTEDTTKVN